MWKCLKHTFFNQFLKLLLQRILQIHALRDTDLEYRCKCIEIL